MTIVKKTVMVTAIRSPSDINVSIEINSDYVVTVTSPPAPNIVIEPTNIPVVGSAILGPQGPPGLPGPPGPQGSGGDANYIHDQLSPSDQWIVYHALNKFPSVMVVDSGGTVIETDIHYDNNVQLRVLFGSPTSGKAYLN